MNEIKRLIKNLSKGRWAEVKVCGIDGYFDCTCKAHLKHICSFGKIEEWKAL